MNPIQNTLTTFACSYHSKYCDWGPDPVPPEWEAQMQFAEYMRNFWWTMPLLCIIAITLIIFFNHQHKKHKRH